MQTFFFGSSIKQSASHIRAEMCKSIKKKGAVCGLSNVALSFDRTPRRGFLYKDTSLPRPARARATWRILSPDGEPSRLICGVPTTSRGLALPQPPAARRRQAHVVVRGGAPAASPQILALENTPRRSESFDAEGHCLRLLWERCERQHHSPPPWALHSQ